MFVASVPVNLATARGRAIEIRRDDRVAAEPQSSETLADRYDLDWWNYRLPRRLERRFTSETDTNRNRQIRLWIAIGLGFSWLTFAIDLVSVPDVWWLGLLLRLCAVTPVSLVAMRLLDTTGPRWWQTMLASVMPLAVAHLTVLIGFAASAEVDTFRSAMVLCFGILWMNVLIPLRLRDTLVFSLVTLTIGDCLNLTAAFERHVAFQHADMIVVGHLLVLLSLLVRFLAERESRHSFVLGLRLRSRAEDLARSNRRLQEMSDTDPLTGLANRRSFDRALSQTWQTAAVSGASVSMMMIDVDHFKLFNDVAGHLEGDRCLTTIARTIAGQIRRGADLAARFGGEEFVVLMPGTGHDDARRSAERVRTAIAALRVFHPGRTAGGFVSVSVGVATLRPADPGTTSAALLTAADAAMYAAKAAGRDRVMGDSASSLETESVS